MTTQLRGGVVSAPGGGDIDIPTDNALEYPGHITQRADRGVAFGPLEVTPYPDTTATVGGLTYKTATSILDPDSWFGDNGDGGLLSAGLLGGAFLRPSRDRSRSETDVDVGRREFVKALAASAAVLAGSVGVATAAEESRTVARFSLPANIGGVRLRLLDTVPDVMPPGQVYRAFANGIQYDHIGVGENQYGDIPPTVTGQIHINHRSRFLSALKEFAGEKKVKYPKFTITNDAGDTTAPTDAGTGQRLTITDNDIIVRHQILAGQDSTLRIGGQSIPHRSESQSTTRGWYGIHDDTIVYRVGSKPPSATTAQLIHYPSAPEEFGDDVRRRL
jgi:hypothetical protein